MIFQNSQSTLIGPAAGASATGTNTGAYHGGTYFIQTTGTLGAASFLQVQHPDGTWVNFGPALSGTDFFVTFPAVPVRAITGSGASGVTVWATRVADAPVGSGSVGAGTSSSAQLTTQASDSPLVVSTGSIADAAATDSTSSWSEVALLKGLLAQMLSTAPAQVYRADSYLNITGQATTVVKSGAGTLSRIVLNAPTATEVITIYDNTAASGTIIAKITIPASPQPVSIEFGVAFATGLTILTATASSDLTAVYR